MNSKDVNTRFAGWLSRNGGQRGRFWHIGAEAGNCGPGNSFALAVR